MGRKATWPPQMRRHHTGRARVCWKGEEYYPGVYGTPEAEAEYKALLIRLAEEEARPKPLPGSGPTVAQAVALWVAEELPLRSEKEASLYRRALSCLCRVRGSMPAAQFGADDLRAVRRAMLSGSWLAEAEKAGKRPAPGRGGDHPPCGQAGPWSRRTANRAVGRLKTVWRWLSEESRRSGVPAEAYGRLLVLKALRAGTPGVPPDPARPLPGWLDIVRVALAIRQSPCRWMLLVQMLSGMRSGEVRRMLWDEIDASGAAWVYRPAKHKLSHLGIPRVIVLGPRAQAVLRQQREREPRTALVFPCRQRGRLTGAYSRHAYASRCRKAARKIGVPHFRPYAARHAARDRASGNGSLEEARSILGHVTASMTAQYGQRHDLALATKAAMRDG
jgi:integrase